MLAFVQLLGTLVANLFRSQRLEVENLFLRHQLNFVAALSPQQGFVVPKGVIHRTRAPEKAVIRADRRRLTTAIDGTAPSPLGLTSSDKLLREWMLDRLAPLAHRLRVLIDLHWAARDAHRSFDARSPEEAARLRTERAVRQHARSNRALYILR